MQEEEIAKKAVYDRQIRLWGAEAQQRIGSSWVLLMGFGGVNVELCKNLILAGISVTVSDSSTVKLSDLGHNFFLREDDVGKKKNEACLGRVQELNPFAKAESVDEDVGEISKYAIVSIERTGKSQDAKYYQKIVQIAQECREKQIAFFYSRADVDGGISVSDLGSSFAYKPEVATAQPSEIQAFPSFTAYATLSPSKWNFIAGKRQPQPTAIWLDQIDALYAKDTTSQLSYLDFARDIFKKNNITLSDQAIHRHSKIAGAQMVYVTAVLGGMLGQECIKAIAKKGEPTNNVFVFDANTDSGTVYLRVGADPESDQKKATTDSTNAADPPAKRPKLTHIQSDTAQNADGALAQNSTVILNDD